MRLFLLLLAAVVVAIPPNSSHLVKFFGSKTPYYSRPRTATCPTFSPIPNETEERGTPKALFMLVRHGSRFPTAKHLESYDKLRQHEFLRNWTHEFDPQNEGLLTPTGVEEMRELGRQVGNLFPSLFASGYHPRMHHFRSSKVTRTLQSASAFASGLFPHEAVAVESESPSVDVLLRFHENCPKYQAEKKLHTPSTQRLVQALQRKLETRVGILLESKELQALWSVCMFETNPKSQCEYFDESDGELLEYLNDVHDYWEKGLGRRLNYAMSCPLVDHLLDTLKSRGNPTRFLFGHAETIMPLVAALGLFQERDEAFVPDELVEDWRARRYKTGFVAPFAANLIVALVGDDKGREVVRVWHNGDRMDVSHICKVCTWEEFHAGIRRRLGECDYTKMCTVE